jgi:peroxiredoxin
MIRPRLTSIVSGIPLLVGLLAVAGCAQKDRTAAGPAPYPDTLQGRLDLYQSESVPPPRTKLQDGHIAELRDTGVAERALKVGAKAPVFELPGVSGEPVRLGDLLREGPAVLVWYRGGWSPQCMIALRTYAEVHPQIRELGATLVAISPQTADNSELTQMLGQFEFEVLSDTGNHVARQFGLVYKLSPGAAADLRQAVSLREYNGDDSGELPLTATYVIDREGVIRYAFVDPDYRRRAEPADVLAALKELAASPEEQPATEAR